MRTSKGSRKLETAIYFRSLYQLSLEAILQSIYDEEGVGSWGKN